MNADCGVWVSNLLNVGPSDHMLEVGFGPGVIIQRLSLLAAAGHVAGIDPSREMIEQARTRDAVAIQSGHVDLRRGSVESLPFDDNSFDKALAINSMQVWPDALAGLREMWRVTKLEAESRLALRAIPGSRKKDLRKHSSPMASRKRRWWRQEKGSAWWRQRTGLVDRERRRGLRRDPTFV
jgi:ubiquinone/menaquinone biosynthesis C-methylase UbiE